MLTLKTFIRSIRKRKTLSILTIGGYAVGLAVLLIMVSFIISEKNINRSFENRKNIYRIVQSEEVATIPVGLKTDIKASVPGIEKMSLYSFTSGKCSNNDTIVRTKIIATDDDFLDIFSFQFIHKAPEPTLSIKDNIILTQSFSEKLFGKTNPIGNILYVNDVPSKVVGIVNDVPKTASFSFDIMICKDLSPAVSYSLTANEERLEYYSFFLVNKNVDIKTIEKQIIEIASNQLIYRSKSHPLSIQQFRDVYFNPLLYDGMEHANISMIHLLLSIAAVIFFMTIFNYVNLTISSGYDRLKEIGIKKTAGARNKDIFWQVLNEAMFVSLIAIIIAVLTAYLIAPLFSELLGKEIELNYLFSQPLVILSVISLLIITGILSGFYPALAFSKLLPLQILSLKRSPKNSYRQGGFIAVQFIITICLIISVLFINKQLEYVKHADLGFNRNLLRITMLDFTKDKSFKKELLKNPNIVAVSISDGSPMQIYGETYINPIQDEGSSTEFSDKHLCKCINVDEDFVRTFDLEIVEGRDFNESSENECLINEHLYKELGREDVIGTITTGYKIVGVIKDFNYENLYRPIGNLMLRLDPEANNSVYIVSFTGDVKTAKDLINKTAAEFDYIKPISFQFYDEYVQSFYTKEEKQAKSVTMFSIIAVLISCLGLIGMIEQTTHRKIKEIGIRKVNGAKVTKILALLNKNIIKWVTIAFTVATPIAYYAMNQWLQNFAYKTNLCWWIFALAGVLALGIALLTTSWQSWRAATKNPVESLRYE